MTKIWKTSEDGVMPYFHASEESKKISRRYWRARHREWHLRVRILIARWEHKKIPVGTRTGKCLCAPCVR